MISRSITVNALQPSLDDLKRHLRLAISANLTDRDTLLTSYLKAASVQAEHFIGRYFEESTFVLTDNFSKTVVLEGVTKDYPIKTITVKVDSTALSSSQYSVSGDILTFAEGVTGENIEITWTAGGHTVEDDIRAAILLMAGRLFNNPVDSVETLPTQSQALLRPYRKWSR